MHANETPMHLARDAWGCMGKIQAAHSWSMHVAVVLHSVMQGSALTPNETRASVR